MNETVIFILVFLIFFAVSIGRIVYTIITNKKYQTEHCLKLGVRNWGSE